MSNFREQIETVEILDYETQIEDLEDLEGIIEYLPEDEYQTEIVYALDELDNETLEDKWIHTKLIVQEESENDVKILDSNIKIKLLRDQDYYDAKERVHRCCNKSCKRINIVHSTLEEMDEHNYDHVKQIAMNICPICNKELATQQKLKWHMEVRHIPRNFVCDHCGKIFHSKDNIRLHMSHHRKHFIVECRACKRTYKSVQSLRYHLRQHFEHHQCETCGQVFEHKKLLLGHVAARHNHELMLPCRYCTRTFSRSDVRDIHERDIHKNGAVLSHFSCDQCEKSFDFRSDLMKHKIENHYYGTVYPCGECNKQFKKKSLLKLHMSSHREKSIQCDVCQMMFTFVTGLAKHKKMGRCRGPAKKNPSELSKEEIARIAKQQLLEITVNFTKLEDLIVGTDEDLIVRKQRKREETNEITYQSPKSSPKKVTKPSRVMSFVNESPTETITSSSGRVIKRKLPQEFIVPSPSKTVVIIGKKEVENVNCDICGEDFESKSELSEHVLEHNQKSHKCLFCDRSFMKVMTLRKHYQEDHPDANPYKEKKYQCSLCPKRYLTDFLLGQHMLSHENLKSQKCALCDFATNTLYDLKNHFRRIHQASKDFECTEKNCGKTFKRRCDMENHRKSVHTLFKVYVKCPVCDVIVLEKGLQSHMINRHSDKASQKPYKCNYCGKAERYEKNLQRHIESVHEPADRGVTYHCDKCPASFYRRRELTAHSFEHFNGTIYPCTLCDNKYKSKKELTNHMYSHKSVQYPCEYCGQVFQTKSGRAKHYRKHQSQEDTKDYEVYEIMKEEMLDENEQNEENDLIV